MQSTYFTYFAICEVNFNNLGGSGEDLGTYGHGEVRTFEQYIAFSGVDPPHNIASSGDQCGELDWVPYDHEVRVFLCAI